MPIFSSRTIHPSTTRLSQMTQAVGGPAQQHEAGCGHAAFPHPWSEGQSRSHMALGPCGRSPGQEAWDDRTTATGAWSTCHFEEPLPAPFFGASSDPILLPVNSGAGGSRAPQLRLRCSEEILSWRKQVPSL